MHIESDRDFSRNPRWHTLSKFSPRFRYATPQAKFLTMLFFILGNSNAKSRLTHIKKQIAQKIQHFHFNEKILSFFQKKHAQT